MLAREDLRIDAQTLLERYAELAAKVDAHAASVEAAHPDGIQCRPGCAGCCQGGLTVSPLEAGVIARFDPRPPAEGTRRFTVLDEGRDDCVRLDSAGRCTIHPVRPLVCRSHGLPILFTENGVRRGDSCPLNFEAGLRALQAGDFLDQDVLHTVLAVLNQAWCELHELDPTARISV